MTVTGGGTQHNNQATYIEAARIDRLLQAFLNLQSVHDERFHELVGVSLRELKHSLLVANCANCTIFVFNPDLIRTLARLDKQTSSSHGLTLQKFAMEGGKWIDGICEMDRDILVPAFKKPEDVRGGFKNH